MLLTKDEVARMLRISLRTLDRLRLLGFLPCVRIRGCVRFTEEDVQKCVDERRKHGLQSWRDE
jgi:excisionase family DNA binding protein